MTALEFLAPAAVGLAVGYIAARVLDTPRPIAATNVESEIDRCENCGDTLEEGRRCISSDDVELCLPCFDAIWPDAARHDEGCPDPGDGECWCGAAIRRGAQE